MPQTIAGIICNALASTVISIGTITLLYELFMRRTLQREVLNLVGIEKSLSQNMLYRAGQAQEVPWGSLLDHFSECRALLLEPDVWLENQWHLISDSATEGAAKIILMLPNPDGDYIAALARLLQRDPGEYATSIRRASQSAEQRWGEVARSGRLRRGSSIEVRLLDELPTHSVVMADHKFIVVMATPFGKRGPDPSMFFYFKGSVARYPNSWLAGQLGDGTPSVPTFANEVQ
jgi:hypothetical protein